MKDVHTTGLTKVVVNGWRTAYVVGQDIIAGRFREQSEFVWFKFCSPISKFPADGAIAFECVL